MDKRPKRDVPLLLSADTCQTLQNLFPGEDLSAPQTINKALLMCANLISVARELVPFFVEDFIIHGHSFIGRDNARSYKELLGSTQHRSRYHCKLSISEWRIIAKYQRALDAPLNHTALIILETGLPYLIGKPAEFVIS